MGAINEHNQEAVAKLRHSAFDEFRATKMETESESAEQAAARVNSEDIIEPVNDLVMGEYYRSQKETCCCLEVLVKDGNFVPLNQDNMDCKVGGEQVRHFLVRTYDLNMGGTLLSVNGLESFILSDQTCSLFAGGVDYHRPIYERTRHVTAEEVTIDGKTFVCLKCHSCGFFHHNFFCGCRHVYRVLCQPPTKGHFSPSCYKTYEICYGREEPFDDHDQLCDLRTETLKSYGGILLEMELRDVSPRPDVILGTEAFDFFISGYGKLIDCNYNSKDMLGDEGEGGTSSAPHIAPVLSSSLHLSGSSSNMDPYTRFHPVFASAMDQIRSKEQADIASEKLHEMLEVIMRKGKGEQSNVGVASYPSIDNKKRHKRKRPAEERH